MYEFFRIQVFSLPVFIHRTILDPKNLATPGDIQCLEYFTQDFFHVITLSSSWSNFSGTHGKGARLVMNFHLIITLVFRLSKALFLLCTLTCCLYLAIQRTCY